MREPLGAAVIGLGNIGFLFDLDPKRNNIWSHSRAYFNSKTTKLVAAVEPDSKKAKIFSDHYPGIPVYKNVKGLFEKHSPELISICTPTATHFDIFMKLLGYSVAGIICEKPFAVDVEQARKMTRVAQKKGVVTAVNHTRRYMTAFATMAEMIDRRKYGELVCLRAVYPGQIYNIGTHLLDIMSMVAGRLPIAVSGTEIPGGDEDPHICGRIWYEGGTTASFDVAGKRERLIFELEALAELGRIKISDNGARLEVQKYVESPYYSGYLELFPDPVDVNIQNEPLLDLVEDTAMTLLGEKDIVRCAATDGLIALMQIERLVASAKAGGEVMELDRSLLL